MDRRDVLNAALAGSLFSTLPGAALAKAANKSAFEPIIKYLSDADAIASSLGYTGPALKGAYHTLVMASLSAAYIDTFGTRVEDPSWVPYIPYFIPYVGPNPDTCYNFAPVEANGVYRISGRNGTETISTITMVMGGDHIGKIVGKTVGEIDRLALKTDAGGNYSFMLSAKPVSGYSGEWFGLPAKATALMSRRVIKEISQTDGVSAIERLDVPVARLDYSAEEVAHRLQMVAEAATDSTRFALNCARVLRKRGAVDGLIIDDQTPYSGLITQIYFFHLFKLERDEALIYESDVPASRYMSLQLFDPLITTLDFVQHQSSLNDRQLHFDADGHVRVVLCASDPGVANCLDTGGWLQGGMIWRWNNPASKPQAKLIKVRLKNLPQSLPADTRHVSAEERRAVLSDRKALYQQRVH